VLENVVGFLTHQYQFQAALRSACGDRYVTTFRKVNMQFYGVPQHRYRVIVIGALRDFGTDVGWPEPDCPEVGGYRRYFPSLISMKDALEDLGPASAVDRRAKDVRFGQDHVYVPFESRHYDICRHIPNGGSLKDIPDKYLPSQYAGRNRVRNRGWMQYYRKPLPDLPGRTVLASIGPTFSTIQAPDVNYHFKDGRWHWKCISPAGYTSRDGLYTSPVEPRRLTIRECARLQTFPDWFRFEGNVLSCYRMIGNAVPCEYARRLCVAIHRLISGEGGPQGTQQLSLALASSEIV
jgi:DNA (cytosine-5)-methyltransferase 1